MPFTITTEFGHALPPEPRHAITMHCHGWAAALRFRDGDPTLVGLIKSTYPRFGPWGDTMKLVVAIYQKVGTPPSYGGFAFTSPDAFRLARDYAGSPHRDTSDICPPEELLYRVVDVSGVRVYAVFFPGAKGRGILGVWQNPGIGVSSRLAQHLLKGVKTMVEVPLGGGDVEATINSPPPPTWLPESEAHGAIRARVVQLLKRAPIDAAKVDGLTEADVLLYGTGMAAIYYLHKGMMAARPGKMLVLGSVFHNSWHLFEEGKQGMKHFGHVDSEGIDEVEKYLEEETAKGQKFSYIVVEFPSNPILASADLGRLRKIADKFSIPLTVDDTVGGFANLDLFSASVDVLTTSLTKSFSGYSDVMGGSLVLNPQSAHYADVLKPHLAATHHNELFAGDAAVLLANSADYLARWTLLNRNASAVATAIAAHVAAHPGGACVGALHPLTSAAAVVSGLRGAEGLANYRARMRPATADFAPGYGCLLSVDFRTVEQAMAFYDNLGFYHGPHLGAHRSLAVPFNTLVFGRNPKEAEYHAGYGARGTQVRLAPGLEAEEDLLQIVQAALDKADQV